MELIYAPLVANSTLSFETDPPTEAEMRRRITDTVPQFPWLVCESGGDVLGYTYAHEHRSRPAYRWSVDVSVYVRERSRQTGVGRALYESLIAVLALQGFHNAHAGIALPNRASVRLHEAVGFDAIGVYPDVGYKHGAWHDVGWWRLSLRERSPRPEPPKTIEEIRGSSEWTDALRAGTPFVEHGDNRASE